MGVVSGAVVITGVGSGLGRALAHALADRGVVVIGLDQQPLDPSIPVDHFVLADVAEPGADAEEAVVRLVAAVQDCTVIHCAAIAPRLAWDAFGLDDFETCMAVNLGGLIGLVALFRDRWLNNARTLRVVAVSSPLARHAFSQQGAYSASKAALDRFMEWLARDCPGNVSCLTVSPGSFRSGLLPNAVPTDLRGRRFVARIATTPDRVADQIVHLLERGRRGHRYIGWDSRALDLSCRISPAVVARFSRGARRRIH
jgi:NAD(P)-dependent dehydrogenase (short-subunit alcohol dehydrogenase family)